LKCACRQLMRSLTLQQSSAVCRSVVSNRALLVTNLSVHRAWNNNGDWQWIAHWVTSRQQPLNLGSTRDRQTDGQTEGRKDGRTSFDWGRNLVMLIPGYDDDDDDKREEENAANPVIGVFNSLVMNSESTRRDRAICTTRSTVGMPAFKRLNVIKRWQWRGQLVWSLISY